MANNGRMNTGSMPRLLQYGVDKIITHYDKVYKGVGDMIFTSVDTEKGFYEMVQLAGAGMAALKNEGDVISTDSIDQDWVRRWPIYTYEKSFRVTREAIDDNVYEDLIPMIGKEQSKAINANRDYQQANILNRAFNSSYTGPDGKVLCATDHPVQAGGTSTNRLSPDLDLSEDAVEQAVILANKMVGPDGLPTEYETSMLVVPTELMYIADRIVGSKYRTSTTDNDINAVMHRGDVKDYIVWKRLSDSDAWFLTTNSDDCLITARRQSVKTRSWENNETYDVQVTAYERFRALFADWRGIVGTQGA